MSNNTNTIRKVTVRGQKSKLLGCCGNEDWDREHPDSDPSSKLGVGVNSFGDVEFRFPASRAHPYEYVVTLTPAELHRAIKTLEVAQWVKPVAA